MDKVIKTISEIEKKANQIVNNGNIFKKSLDEDNLKKQQELEETINNETQTKLTILKSQWDLQTAEEISLIHQNNLFNINKIKDTNTNHADEIADIIFQNITEV